MDKFVNIMSTVDTTTRGKQYFAPEIVVCKIDGSLMNETGGSNQGGTGDKENAKLGGFDYNDFYFEDED